MAATSNKLKLWWNSAEMPLRLMALNVAMFLVIIFGEVVCKLTDSSESLWLGLWAMPADIHTLAMRPWTPITYMFTQYDVLHLLFNMLWLYCFGRIFMMLADGWRLVVLYICGGLAGAVVFVAGCNILGDSHVAWSSLVGASAAVMSIVTGAATIYPEMPLRMMLLGDIKLKWIAVGALVLFVVTSTGEHAGSQFAHIGGAVMGFIYGLQMRRGRDISMPILRWINTLCNLLATRKAMHKPRFKRFNKRKANAQKQPQNSTKQQPFTDTDQRRLDAILDKVKKSGYTGLTAEEKRELFDVSRRIK